MEKPPKVAYIGAIKPPYSDVINTLGPATIGSKVATIIGFTIGAAIFGGLIWFVGMLFGWKWLSYLGIVISVCLAVALGRKALRAQSAPCPYCGANIEAFETLASTDQNRQFACGKCHEWLVSDSGSVRAFRDADIGERKEFDCPVFANGIWPEECVVCGAAATRRLSARTFGVGGAGLLIGRLSVSFGSVKDIPYCDNHKEAVSIKTVDKKIWAVFDDYAARRRYLHVNRSRFAAMTKCSK